MIEVVVAAVVGCFIGFGFGCAINPAPSCGNFPQCEKKREDSSDSP